MTRFVLTLAALLLVRSACAQCTPHWLYGPGHGTGDLTANVHSLTTWDPDGTGPLTPRLVIGGIFDFGISGQPLCRSVLSWDGTNWVPLGQGLNQSVFALGVWNGTLIAGGGFTATGSTPLNRIAAFDGAAWQPLGAGINGQVRAIAVFNGNLYAGGDFDTVNALTPASDIARWNGSSWETVAGGTSGGVVTEARNVRALTVFQNNLVVAGVYHVIGGLPIKSIARWDGTVFSSLGPGGAVTANPAVPGTVTSLGVTSGELIAAGEFAQIGGLSVVNVASWNGTAWQPMSSGISGGPLYAVEVFNNEPVVGGFNLLRRFTGSGWIDLPGFIGGGQQPTVHALVPLGPELIAAGDFLLESFGPPSALARFDGSAWNRFPSVPARNAPLSVEDMIVFDDRLIAAGPFTAIGPVPARGIAAFDGIQWSALGAGLDGARALAIVNNELVAVGLFSGVGSPVMAARFDGQAWQQFGTPPPTGGGAACAAVFDNKLVIAGFLPNLPQLDNRVLMWNGAAWQQLGPATGSTGLYEDMEVYHGELYINGPVRNNAGVSIAPIARWNGSDWTSVGPPIQATRPFLCVHDGRLIVSNVTSINGTSVGNIAAWDGTSWSPLGIGFVGQALDLESHAGRLFVGGNITQAGGAPAANFIAWDGSSWSGLSGGINGTVSDLAGFGTEVIASGIFTTAGGLTSYRWARFGCECYANCDGSTGNPILTGNDFQCFINRFAAGSSIANCDGSTIQPVLTGNDFQCFLNAFVAGCS